MRPTLRRILAFLGLAAAAAYSVSALAAPAPQATQSASVTRGSDLTGEPVPIRGTRREDSEFWNKGVHAPASGTITKSLLEAGDTPMTIPISFAVVRPVAGGKVKVIT